MKKILSILLVSFLVISCKDFLNMPPKNVKVVYTMEDVKEAMSLFLYGTLKSNAGTGTANTLNNLVYFGGGRIQFPFSRYVNVASAMCSDDINMVGFVNENQDRPDRGGYSYESEYQEIKNWEGYSFAETIWKGVYLSVGYLNMVLKDLSNVPDYNKVEYERIAGEARVIRAYYLLRLNQLFAPYDNNDLGIPINFDVDDIKGGPRLKHSEVYKILLGELKDVLDYETVPKDSWNVFYNKKIIYAILAQVYQYKAGSAAGEKDDWNKAEIFARDARDGNRVENTIEEQQELNYVPDDRIVNKPHPFALLRFSLLGDGGNGYAPWGTVGLPQQKPVDDLFEMYDADDIRVAAFFKIVDGKPYFVKLQSLGSVDYCNETHPLFRMSDLLLIEAEAKMRQGNEEGARMLLDEFKRSKIPGYMGDFDGDVLAEILKERRKEFILEEQMRWLDMKRLGVSVSREASDDESLGLKVYTLDANDYRYTLPIPLDSELQYNNIQQNPGWKH